MWDLAKSLFCYAKACIHLDFVFLAFGEIACAAQLKFLSAMTLFLQLISASLYKVLQETRLSGNLS